MIFRNKWLHQRKTKWQFMTRLELPEFTRFTLFRTPWLEVFFNRVFCADPSRYAHTHPWTFLSILLRGNYTERRQTRAGHWCVLTRRWFNAIRYTTPHRITQTNGFLSLVIALPRADDFQLYDMGDRW